MIDPDRFLSQPRMSESKHLGPELVTTLHGNTANAGSSAPHSDLTNNLHGVLFLSIEISPSSRIASMGLKFRH